MIIKFQRDSIYVAYGNNVLSWSLSTQQLKVRGEKHGHNVILSVQATYSGHSKYIHCLTLRPPEKQLMTGSEDGTVKIWSKIAKMLLSLCCLFVVVHKNVVNT